jgi:anti-sigma28 factor (negative regulator of flagellin synthesis)
VKRHKSESCLQSFKHRRSLAAGQPGMRVTRPLSVALDDQLVKRIKMAINNGELPDDTDAKLMTKLAQVLYDSKAHGVGHAEE